MSFPAESTPLLNTNESKPCLRSAEFKYSAWISLLRSINVYMACMHNAALCGKFGAQRETCPTAVPCYMPMPYFWHRRLICVSC